MQYTVENNTPNPRVVFVRQLGMSKVDVGAIIQAGATGKLECSLEDARNAVAQGVVVRDERGEIVEGIVEKDAPSPYGLAALSRAAQEAARPGPSRDGPSRKAGEPDHHDHEHPSPSRPA